MRLSRRSPSSLAIASGYKTVVCPACERPIAQDDEFVCLYGEPFHRDCTHYRLEADKLAARRR
jgi:hypothetical protein